MRAAECAVRRRFYERNLHTCSSLCFKKMHGCENALMHPSAACCSADGQSGSFVPPAAASPPRGRKPSKDAAYEALTATWCCCSGSCLICSVIVSPYSHTLAGCSKHRSVAASRRRRCTCARAPLTEWPSARDVGSPCWSACVLRV